MRLPDRYYDLILDRDQLLEEESDLLRQPYINYLEHLVISYKYPLILFHQILLLLLLYC